MQSIEQSIGSLRDGAVACHEMYSSFVKAGFNSSQALELTKVWLAELLRSAGSRAED